MPGKMPMPVITTAAAIGTGLLAGPMLSSSPPTVATLATDCRIVADLFASSGSKRALVAALMLMVLASTNDHKVQS